VQASNLHSAGRNTKEAGAVFPPAHTAHLGFLAHSKGDPGGMESLWLLSILLAVACTGNTLHNSPLLVYTLSYTPSILSTIIQRCWHSFNEAVLWNQRYRLLGGFLLGSE